MVVHEEKEPPPQSLKGPGHIFPKAAMLHRPLVDSGVVELHEENVRAADTRIGVAIQGAECVAGHPGVSGGVHLRKVHHARNQLINWYLMA